MSPVGGHPPFRGPQYTHGLQQAGSHGATRTPAQETTPPTLGTGTAGLSSWWRKVLPVEELSLRLQRCWAWWVGAEIATVGFESAAFWLWAAALGLPFGRD